MIKFNAWEKLISQDFEEVRKEEQKSTLTKFLINGFTEGITDITPFIASVVSLWLYNKYKGTLTIPQLF
jgi:hypothetical protein